MVIDYMPCRRHYNAYVRFSCGLLHLVMVPQELIDDCNFYSLYIHKPQAEPFSRVVTCQYMGTTQSGVMKYVEADEEEIAHG